MPELSATKLLLHNPEGHLLLLKRSEFDAHRPGTFDLPGGGLDKDEDPLDAIVRETREEIGLIEDQIELQCYFDRTYTSRNLGRVTTKRFFVGRTVGFAAVRLSEEHTDIAWLPPELAASIAGHPVQQEAIAYVHMPDYLIPLERAQMTASTSR